MLTKNLLIKTSLAVIFIAVLLYFVDFEQLASLLQQLALLELGYALVVVLVIRGLMALRWQMILNAHSISMSYVESLYIILASGAFGFFSPGGIAADFLKGHHVYGKEKSVSRIAVIVMFDKLIGVLSMFAVVAIFSSVLLILEYQGDTALLQWVAAASSLVIVGAIATVMLLVRYENWFNGLLGRAPAKVSKLFAKLYAVFKEAALNKSLMIKVVLLSLAMQLLRSLMFYFILQSLQLEVALLSVIAYFPLVFMLMLLPITLGGIGVREGATFVLFKQFGVTLDHSVGSGVVFYGLQLLVAILGFAVYLAFSKRFGRQV